MKISPLTVGFSTSRIPPLFLCRGTYFIVFTGSGSVRAAMPPFSAPPVATAATLEPSPVVGIGADRGFNPSFRAARSSGVIGTFTLEAIDDCIAWAGV